MQQGKLIIFDFPEPIKAFMGALSIITKGVIMITVTNELINSKVAGDWLLRIFWSRVYTNPHITAAPIE